MREPNFRRFGMLLLAAAICGIAAAVTHGAALWLAGFAALVLALLAFRDAIRMLAARGATDWKVDWMTNLAVIVATIGIWVAGFEAYLGWLESSAVSVQASAGTGPKPAADAAAAEGTGPGKTPVNDIPARFLNSEFALPPDLRTEMKRRSALLSLPKEWEKTEWGKKRLEAAGAHWAYTWHGIEHIYDKDNFRRPNGPFPEKRADTMRVMVVGDSLTYGAGIREEWSYTARLQRAMQKAYRIEFFNLGVSGAQSEDILKRIERMLPSLKPDLVIYGVCHNDFLPSGIGEYKNKHEVPLPKWLKLFLAERTRFVGFLGDNYRSMLILLGFSMDFYDDILKDFNGYQRRFAADVRRMNEVVRARGLPPIVGMTLDQYVQAGGRGHRISQTAERFMQEAGFVVISTDAYYKAFNGRQFNVSRWEGHPDEEANSLFAAMLHEHLARRSDVQRYARRDRTASATR